MKRILFSLAILFASLFSAFAQKYEKMWEEVELLKTKGLPRSAIVMVEKMRDRAERKGDFAWEMRAEMELMMLRADVCPDSMWVDVERLSRELAVREERSEGEQTLLLQNLVFHALLGDAYRVLADKSRGDNDLYAEYINKARGNFVISLSDWDALADASADDYGPLMSVLGREEDTRLYNDDMLNVLAMFKTESQYQLTEGEYEMFDSLTQFYAERGNRNGALLMRIAALKNKRWLNDWNERLSYEDYRDSLLVLARGNRDIEAGADAYADLLRAMTDNERKSKITIADEAIKAFPTSVHRGWFEQVKAKLNRGKIVANVIGDAYDPVKVELKYCGVENCRLSFYHHGRKRMEAVRDVKLNLSYEEVVDTLQFVLTPGNYRMTVESDSIKDTVNVDISSMVIVAGAVPGGKNIVTVVDGNTGRPKEGVMVSVKARNKNANAETSVTDEWGQVGVSSPEDYWTKVVADGGCFDRTQTENMLRRAGMSNEVIENTECRLFTDRSLYRPGQTVNVAALLFTKCGDETSALTDKNVTVVLQDANGRETERKDIKTNAMGSVATEFVLPKDGLPGVYTISCKSEDNLRQRNYSVAFRVEEYKRPTFMVDMVVGQKGYALGDSVTVEGRAMTFSGVPVQNAEVKYRVEYRNVSFWYRYGAGWTVAKSGTLATDEEGRFSTEVYLDPNKRDGDLSLQEYRVTAEVVNGVGETQSGEVRMAVSKNTFELMADVPSVIVVGDEEYANRMKVSAMDLAQKEIDVNCEYRVYRRRKTLLSDMVCVGRTDKYVKLPDGLAPGDYRIDFLAIDKVRDFATGGEISDTVRTSADFTLFDPDAKTMEVVSDFIYSKSDEMNEQQPADIYYMPEYKDVTLYWMLVCGDSLVDKGVRRVDGEMQHFHVDYKEEYGDGVSLSVFYVKNFEVYFVNKIITLTKPDKQLGIRWNTFRDKLIPGQQETWTLSIKDKKGRAVDAEVLATMYDASLDKIVPHEWRFGLDFMRRVRPVSFAYSNRAFGRIQLEYPLPDIEVKRRVFDKLMNVSSPSFPYNQILREVTVAKAPVLASKSVMRLAGTGGTVVTQANDAMVEESVETESEGGVSLSLRSDFAETAFFYPHIKTDKSGEAIISFTLPESLTEWKFMGLAHTGEMNYGMIESRAVASKDFMVQPNMPRFVRAGDKVTITSNIVNRTDRAISGDAVMTLIDPETEKIVVKERSTFSVEDGHTTAVSFSFDAMEDFPLLICQVEASGNSFSDGERNYLPVLSSKQVVTTTVPFFIDGTEDKTVNIDGLFNGGSETATNHKMTIEYYGNPAWMAVEALRSVVVPETDNAISASAALYANMVAQYIAGQIPGFASVKKDDSPLEENQELKAILLCESPWMVEALEETDNMGKLADLLDEGNMEARMQKAVDKLRKLQNADGSWSWFEGMEGNIHITTMVVEHIVEAERLTGVSGDMHDAMLKGLDWLDKEEVKKYEQMKADEQTACVPSESTLRYLYVCSLVERKADSAVVAMRNAYLDKAEQMVGELTIFGRANIACALNAYGREKTAEEFVKSLREYMVYKPEQGRYYDTDKAQYSWCDYRMPSHLAAMKAMRQQEHNFDDTQDYLNDMTLWIIQQKRTQAWDNPINTVGAVNELLANGMLNGESETLPSFVLDDTKRVGMIEGTDNVGYAKAVLEGDDYDGLANVKTLHIKFESQKVNGLNKPKWGAVYGQCVEETRNIARASTETVKIDRKLFVERNSVWEELLEGDTLEVGDKVRIRYTLTTDRDMDFVQVRAQHPACFEPSTQLSGYRRMGACSAYVAQHDASCDFFFDTLRKGSKTFDQNMYVSRSGIYTLGVATAQCAYSPEFSARTQSVIVVVK